MDMEERKIFEVTLIEVAKLNALSSGEGKG
jgi:hypothetical protein